MLTVHHSGGFGGRAGTHVDLSNAQLAGTRLVGAQLRGQSVAEGDTVDTAKQLAEHNWDGHALNFSGVDFRGVTVDQEAMQILQHYRACQEHFRQGNVWSATGHPSSSRHHPVGGWVQRRFRVSATTDEEIQKYKAVELLSLEGIVVM